MTKFAGLTVAVLAAACGRDQRPTTDGALTQDLKAAAAANLTLANQQPGARFAPSEITPKATPQPATRLKRDPGPKVVASPEPTVAAVAEPIVAATVEVPQTQVVETAQATASTVDALPAVSRPVPAASGAGSYGAGEGADVFGGGPRVIIRGGGIGDDDHCEPPGAHRGGGVFLPNPVGVLINRPVPTATFPSGPAGRAGGAAGGVPRRGRGGM
jgi:hypothetical protein